MLILYRVFLCTLFVFPIFAEDAASNLKVGDEVFLRGRKLPGGVYKIKDISPDLLTLAKGGATRFAERRDIIDVIEPAQFSKMVEDKKAQTNFGNRESVEQFSMWCAEYNLKDLARQTIAIEREILLRKQMDEKREKEAKSAEAKKVEIPRTETGPVAEPKESHTFVLPEKTKLDADIETRGTFKNQTTPSTIVPGTLSVAGYEAEGSIVNTGDKIIPFVDLFVVFRGTLLARTSGTEKVAGIEMEKHDKFASTTFILAVGKDTFKNLRPGESRTFKIIVPNNFNKTDGRTQLSDGWNIWNGIAGGASYEVRTREK